MATGDIVLDQKAGGGHWQELTVPATPNTFWKIDNSGALVLRTISELQSDLSLSPWASIVPAAGIGTFLATPTTANFNAATTDADFIIQNNAPFKVYVKNLTVLTTGAPNDIGTITVPAAISRYRITGTSAATATCLIFAETAAGSLVAATFTAWTAAGGTGTQIMASGTGPSVANDTNNWLSQNATTPRTNSTIHIRQLTNSANAGTCSFYITVDPLP